MAQLNHMRFTQTLTTIANKKGKISKVKSIRRKLSDVHYGDCHPRDSRDLSLEILRYISSKKKFERRTPQFASEISQMILCLHEINLEIAKTKYYKYPMSRQFNNLLIKYIEVECESLYGIKTEVDKNLEKKIKQKVLGLLQIILYDALYNDQLSKKQNLYNCKKAVFNLFVHVRAECIYENNLVKSVIVMLLERLGLLEKVKQLKGDNIPFHQDTMLCNPIISSVRDSLINNIFEDENFASDDEVTQNSEDSMSLPYIDNAGSNFNLKKKDNKQLSFLFMDENNTNSDTTVNSSNCYSELQGGESNNISQDTCTSEEYIKNIQRDDEKAKNCEDLMLRKKSKPANSGNINESRLHLNVITIEISDDEDDSLSANKNSLVSMQVQSNKIKQEVEEEDEENRSPNFPIPASDNQNLIALNRDDKELNSINLLQKNSNNHSKNIESIETTTSPEVDKELSISLNSLQEGLENSNFIPNCTTEEKHLKVPDITIENTNCADAASRLDISEDHDVSFSEINTIVDVTLSSIEISEISIHNENKSVVKDQHCINNNNNNEDNNLSEEISLAVNVDKPTLFKDDTPSISNNENKDENTDFLSSINVNDTFVGSLDIKSIQDINSTLSTISSSINKNEMLLKIKEVSQQSSHDLDKSELNYQLQEQREVDSDVCVTKAFCANNESDCNQIAENSTNYLSDEKRTSEIKNYVVNDIIKKNNCTEITKLPGEVPDKELPIEERTETILASTNFRQDETIASSSETFLNENQDCVTSEIINKTNAIDYISSEALSVKDITSTIEQPTVNVHDEAICNLYYQEEKAAVINTTEYENENKTSLQFFVDIALTQETLPIVSNEGAVKSSIKKANNDKSENKGKIRGKLPAKRKLKKGTIEKINKSFQNKPVTRSQSYQSTSQENVIPTVNVEETETETSKFNSQDFMSVTISTISPTVNNVYTHVETNNTSEDSNDFSESVLDITEAEDEEDESLSAVYKEETIDDALIFVSSGNKPSVCISLPESEDTASQKFDILFEMESYFDKVPQKIGDMETKISKEVRSDVPEVKSLSHIPTDHSIEKVLNLTCSTQIGSKNLTENLNVEGCNNKIELKKTSMTKAQVKFYEDKNDKKLQRKTVRSLSLEQCHQKAVINRQSRRSLDSDISMPALIYREEILENLVTDKSQILKNTPAVIKEPQAEKEDLKELSTVTSDLQNVKVSTETIKEIEGDISETIEGLANCQDSTEKNNVGQVFSKSNIIDNLSFNQESNVAKELLDKEPVDNSITSQLSTGTIAENTLLMSPKVADYDANKNSVETRTLVNIVDENITKHIEERQSNDSQVGVFTNILEDSSLKSTKLKKITDVTLSQKTKDQVKPQTNKKELALESTIKKIKEKIEEVETKKITEHFSNVLVAEGSSTKETIHREKKTNSKEHIAKKEKDSHRRSRSSSKSSVDDKKSDHNDSTNRLSKKHKRKHIEVEENEQNSCFIKSNESTLLDKSKKRSRSFKSDEKNDCIGTPKKITESSIKDSTNNDKKPKHEHDHRSRSSRYKSNSKIEDCENSKNKESFTQQKIKNAFLIKESESVHSSERNEVNKQSKARSNKHSSHRSHSKEKTTSSSDNGDKKSRNKQKENEKKPTLATVNMTQKTDSKNVKLKEAPSSTLTASKLDSKHKNRDRDAKHKELTGHLTSGKRKHDSDDDNDWKKTKHPLKTRSKHVKSDDNLTIANKNMDFTNNKRAADDKNVVVAPKESQIVNKSSAEFTDKKNAFEQDLVEEVEKTTNEVIENSQKEGTAPAATTTLDSDKETIVCPDVASNEFAKMLMEEYNQPSCVSDVVANQVQEKSIYVSDCTLADISDIQQEIPTINTSIKNFSVETTNQAGISISNVIPTATITENSPRTSVSVPSCSTVELPNAEIFESTITLDEISPTKLHIGSNQSLDLISLPTDCTSAINNSMNFDFLNNVQEAAEIVIPQTSKPQPVINTFGRGSSMQKMCFVEVKGSANDHYTFGDPLLSGNKEDRSILKEVFNLDAIDDLFYINCKKEKPDFDKIIDDSDSIAIDADPVAKPEEIQNMIKTLNQLVDKPSKEQSTVDLTMDNNSLDDASTAECNNHDFGVKYAFKEICSLRAKEDSPNHQHASFPPLLDINKVNIIEPCVEQSSKPSTSKETNINKYQTNVPLFGPGYYDLISNSNRNPKVIVQRNESSYPILPTNNQSEKITDTLHLNNSKDLNIQKTESYKSQKIGVSKFVESIKKPTKSDMYLSSFSVEQENFYKRKNNRTPVCTNVPKSVTKQRPSRTSSTNKDNEVLSFAENLKKDDKSYTLHIPDSEKSRIRVKDDLIDVKHDNSKQVSEKSDESTHIHKVDNESKILSKFVHGVIPPVKKLPVREPPRHTYASINMQRPGKLHYKIEGDKASDNKQIYCRDFVLSGDNHRRNSSSRSDPHLSQSHFDRPQDRRSSTDNLPDKVDQDTYEHFTSKITSKISGLLEETPQNLFPAPPRKI